MVHCIEQEELRKVLSDAFTRFIEKIEVSESLFFEGTPCWIWKGCTCPRTGYGQFRIDGRRKSPLRKLSSPHRYIYEYWIGEIPADKEIDHLCHVRNCANPVHLQVLTHKDNANRRRNCYAVSGKCKRGHEITKESLYVDPQGKQTCRICRDERMRRFHKRNPDYNRNQLKAPTHRLVRRLGAYYSIPIEEESTQASSPLLFLPADS